MTFQRAGLLVLALLALGLVLRLVVSARQSLWADEVFTLAMATGHSLEHPADAARPELGDFVQGDGARPAAEWARYVRFDSAGIAPRRILRAVALSDTSPPLYYLAVAVWLRVTGVRDSMLHLFSVFWWLLTVPLLWSLALEVGGPRAGRVALALYAIAPMSIYYGTEVRMYSMAWCLAALLAWISLRLSRNGGAGWLAGWVLTAAAGLLTHYFFVFPVAGAAVWLLSHSNRARRVSLLGAALAVAALVFWWYAGLPESLEAWRVTGGWLKGRLGPLDLLANGVKLVLAGLSSPGVAYAPTWVAAAGLAIVVAAIGYAAVRRLLPSCTPPVLLLLLTVAAAALGPVFVDALQGTYTSAIARYALAALPATIALFGGVLAAFPGRQPAAWIGALAVVW
ncbi:MAG: glycosyltransferase family 39 protein, partial [Gemmatimonadota bacterium]|nr:glycosyltransferase family 39 protein [Gemmatimonadota bacterium]